MRFLQRAFRAPPLWAFSVLASVVGIPEAVEICETRVVPMAALGVLERGGWGVQNLPSRRQAEQVIIACRILAAREKTDRSVASVAEEVGVSRLEAAESLAALERVAGPSMRGLGRWVGDRRKVGAYGDGDSD